jgi:peptidoglycan/LPS O-acetylase OafA/YrhL
VTTSGLALRLFSDRTGLLANTLGWPMLSSGFGLLVIAGSDRRSLIGRWSPPGASWIATISYSLYLCHKIAFHLTQEEVVAWLPHLVILLFATYTLAALAGGAALHYLVERPFLRWRDRRASANEDRSPNALERPVAADR